MKAVRVWHAGQTLSPDPTLAGKYGIRDFPVGPAGRTLTLGAKGPGSLHDWGPELPKPHSAAKINK